MSQTNAHDLGPRREIWSTWIKGLLQAAGRQQKTIAYEIEEFVGDRGSKKPAVNRFVKGDPAEVAKWFNEEPEWIDILLRGTDVTPTALRERFRRLRYGEEIPSSWHPAFPDITLADVEIPAPLESILGVNAVAIARREVGRCTGPENWKASSPPQPIQVVAVPSTRRDIAVRQIVKALQAELARVAQGRQIPFTVEATTTPSEGTPEGRWLVVVKDEDHEYDLGTNVRLAPWGPTEVSALALRIAATGRIPDAQSEELRRFAGMLAENPSIVGESLPVDLIIRMLAEVARRGCDGGTLNGRRLLTRAEWSRAQLVGERLTAFDERLMEGLCAEMALRTKDADEAGGWTTAPRSAVLAVLSRVIASIGGVTGGRPLQDLVQAAKQAHGEKQRRAALDDLERAVAADPVAGLFDDLLASRLLVADAPPGDHRVRLPEPVLACTWAARGLGGLPPMEGAWERLVDPDWGFLVGELARGGLPFGLLADILANAPPELCVDTALWLDRHAVAAEAVGTDSRLVGAWATVLWASVHGVFGSEIHFNNRWKRVADDTLRDLSWRCRALLPPFGDDACTLVRSLLSPTVADFVARWRRSPMDRNKPVDHREHWLGLTCFQELDGLDDLEDDLRRASPFQCFPDNPRRWSWWEGRDPARGLLLVQEGARAGNEGCRAMLSGAAWLAEKSRRSTEGDQEQEAWAFWARCPPEVRLDALLQWGPRGTEGRHLFTQLAHELRPKDGGPLPRMDDFVAVGLELGVALLAPLCEAEVVRLLRGDEPVLPSDLLWILCERIPLTKLLDDVVRVPETWIPRANLGVDEYRMFVSFPGQEPLSVQPRLGESWDWGVSEVSIPVSDVLDRIEELAERAAATLHRLGQPEALQRRWKRGGTPIPEALEQRIRWYNGLLRMHLTCPTFWSHLGPPIQGEKVEPPIQGLAPFGRSAPAEVETDRYLRHFLRLPVPESLVSVGRLGEEYVDETLYAAIRGVWNLFRHLPEDLPKDVATFLDTIGGMPTGMYHEPRFEHGALRWSERAARALLDLGDNAPLLTWASGAHNRESPSLEASTAETAVTAWMEKAPRSLERAWIALTSAKDEDGWPPDEKEYLRNRLLGLGSLPWGKEDVPTFSTNPQPFVIAEALATSDPTETEWLTRQNSRSASWAPVLRRHLLQSADARTRAHWAIRLNAVGCDPDEVSANLRAWMLDDTSPFSGGEDWRRVEDRYVGGGRELLASVLSRSEPWVLEGLLRLWQLAVRLPITSERSFSHDEPPESCVLWICGGTAPWPLAPLAEALIKHGHAEDILNTWRNPPLDPAPLADGSDWTRAEHLRHWLEDYWMRHAPDEELNASLLDPARSFMFTVANQLLDRGYRELRPAAERATRLVFPSYQILSMVAPDLLVPSLVARVELSHAYPQLELNRFIEDASRPGWENPRALLEARRAVARLPRSGDGSQRAEGDSAASLGAAGAESK